jgi:hypothetical protein
MVLVAASALIQIIVAIRFIAHRIKIDSGTLTLSSMDNFRKEIVCDFLFCLMFILLCLIYGYLVITINCINPGLINDYPNYLLIYALHFGFPMILSCSFSIFFYAKNKKLRLTLLERIHEILDSQDVGS